MPESKLVHERLEAYHAAIVKYNEWFFSLPVDQQKIVREVTEPLMRTLSLYKEAVAQSVIDEQGRLLYELTMKETRD